MADTLQDQVWIVTGASMGIGAAVAKHVAARGGRPVLAARSADKLEAVAKNFESAQPLCIPTDVTDPDACRHLIEKTVEECGRLDVLVCNAGASMHALFEDSGPDVFRRLMDINYFGVIDCIRPALAHLKKSRGAVVAISSVAGLRGFPTRSGYSASKFALNGLCEALRVELAPSGVDVCVVCPGYVETGIRENALGADGQSGSGAHDNVAGRAMTADECGNAVVRAAMRRKRLVVLTPVGRVSAAMNRWAPALFDKILSRRHARGKI